MLTLGFKGLKEKIYLTAVLMSHPSYRLINGFYLILIFIGTLKLDISPPGDKPPYCLTSELQQVFNNL